MNILCLLGLHRFGSYYFEDKTKIMICSRCKEEFEELINPYSKKIKIFV